MTVTNLSNFTNTLSNNLRKYKHFFKYPASNLIICFVSLLLKENLIRGFFLEKEKNKNYIYILLKYSADRKMFTKIVVTLQNKTIQKNKNGLGVHIVSTTKGLMNKTVSSKLGIGGKSLLNIN